jgi:glycosyltransferase involved in cell wall biosynthesis
MQIQIFLMCHNRPQQAVEAVRSIYTQKNRDFSLVVSDNSSDDTVSNLLNESFESLNIRHRGNIPSFLHAQLCIEEASAPLVCLFHDDDILFPNFTETIISLSRKFPEAIAYATNARIGRIHADNLSEELFLKDKTEFVRLESKSELLKRYFGRFNLGIAPLPSYCYSVSKLRGHNITQPLNKGKFADVIFLLSLLDFGKIIWSTTLCMQYNIHGSNDSLSESIRDRKRLLRHLESLSDQIEKSDLDNYRYAFLKILKSSVLTAGRSLNRLKIINKALLALRLRRYFRLTDYLYRLFGRRS